MSGDLSEPTEAEQLEQIRRLPGQLQWYFPYELYLQQAAGSPMAFQLDPRGPYRGQMQDKMHHRDSEGIQVLPRPIGDLTALLQSQYLQVAASAAWQLLWGVEVGGETFAQEFRSFVASPAGIPLRHLIPVLLRDQRPLFGRLGVRLLAATATDAEVVRVLRLTISRVGYTLDEGCVRDHRGGADRP